MPLTDACPENSCLYVVPRWADPGYFAGDDDDGPDPLAVALAGKEDFQVGAGVANTHVCMCICVCLCLCMCSKKHKERGPWTRAIFELWALWVCSRRVLHLLSVCRRPSARCQQRRARRSSSHTGERAHERHRERERGNTE